MIIGWCGQELDWGDFLLITHILQGALVLKGLVPFSLNHIVGAVTCTKAKAGTLQDLSRWVGKVWKGRGEHWPSCLSPGGTGEHIPEAMLWDGRCCCIPHPVGLFMFGQEWASPASQFTCLCINLILLWQKDIMWVEEFINRSLQAHQWNSLQELQSITSEDEKCCALLHLLLFIVLSCLLPNVTLFML